MAFKFMSVCLLVLLIHQVFSKSFDWQFANTSVWLSADAYCSTKDYESRTYSGYATGFTPTYTIDNKKENVEGFIGYMSSQKTIYVSFRGSTSIPDWINNIDVILTDYSYCSGCEVHKGFYNAQQSVTKEVTAEVQSLLAKYPSYSVVVTGHSLGAAMSLLTALDLYNAGVKSLRLFNFGCPRVGNDAMSAYASSVLSDHNRVTHLKDIVPHIPTDYRFVHIDGEWYESEDGSVKQCSGYEDDTCADQWPLKVLNVDDHMNYLQHYMSCSS